MRALVVLALLSATAHGQPGAPPEPDLTPPKPRTPFDQGRFNLSAGAGAGSSFGVHYYALGVGASYFVLDGLGVGLGTQVQWGDGPTFLELTPDVRYVLQPLVGKSPVVPYVGVFYTHWFIGDHRDDEDALGARGGLLYVSGSLVLGLGVAYEHLLDCVMDCSSIYPDVTVSIAL
jgi:hypothetical protein